VASPYANADFDLFVTDKTMSGSVRAPFGSDRAMNVHFVENL
jgi:hypothetical protein